MKKPKQPVRPDSAPPFQKWAERDFLADTLTMDWQARFMYRALLQAAFSTASTRPNLPNDPDKLQRLLGGIPDDVWNEYKDEVLEMFTISPDGLLLTHRRLQEDFDKLQDYRFAQSKGSAAYWKKNKAERQATERLATRQPLASHTQADVDVDVDVENDSDSDGEVEIPPIRSSSPPFRITESKNPLLMALSVLWTHHRGLPLDMTDSVLVFQKADEYGEDQVKDVFAWFCQHDEHCANPYDQLRPDETFNNFFRRFDFMHELWIDDVAEEAELDAIAPKGEEVVQ